MRVLITNTALGWWSGSELSVRDLAGGLRARGHEPLLFSPLLGPLAAHLRGAGFTVIDDLGLLAAPPDLIHGQHHLETIAALAYCPGAPAVYFCHGTQPWEETPPRHPRIRRYIAAGHSVAQHLVQRCGIPAGEVEVLPLFVDTARFLPRGPLPPRPRRALVFSNYAAAADLFVRRVRKACERLDVTVDLVGARAGNPTTTPEALLGGYDVVFAIGRCALEAMAVGAAVVLCHGEGLGGMVTPGRFDVPLRGQIGRSALAGPVTVGGVEAALRAYDPAVAAAVRDRVRRECSLAVALDRLETVYGDAVAGFPGALSPAAERAALHAYHLWLSREIKGRLAEERERGRAETAALRREAAAREAAAAQRVAELTARLEAVERSLSWRLAQVAGRVPGTLALLRHLRATDRARPETPAPRPRRPTGAEGADAG